MRGLPLTAVLMPPISPINMHASVPHPNDDLKPKKTNELFPTWSPEKYSDDQMKAWKAGKSLEELAKKTVTKFAPSEQTLAQLRSMVDRAEAAAVKVVHTIEQHPGETLLALALTAAAVFSGGGTLRLQAGGVPVTRNAIPNQI